MSKTEHIATKSNAKSAAKSAPTSPAQEPEKPKKARVFSIIINTTLVAMVLVTLGELFGVKDQISAAMFSPSKEVESVLEKLDLTSKGSTIARATRPTLENKENFNKSCEAYSDEVYVLGCYDTKADQLHLFNVENPDLDGIIESTAAHEMLHAAWDRLPFWERQSLAEQLLAVFNNLPADSDLRDSMELYKSDELYDELHSRLGTQIADLPENLENHYAKYFKNQDSVVAFYDKYNDSYKSIQTELGKLEEKITTLGDEIDAMNAHYDTWSNELNNKIVQFNARADDLSETEFTTERTKLQKEINDLDAYFEKLNKKVNEYNQLIEEYNASALHQNEILNSMNSNSSTPPGSTPGFQIEDPDFKI